MNKVSMLTLANIRKTKGHSVSLFILFLISALMLNAGLLVFINFGGFFQKTTEELNASSTYYIMPSQLYTSEVDKYIANNDNVLEMQKEESLWGTGATKYNDDIREYTFLINDADTVRTVSKWKFVGAHLPTEAMSIYMPYLFQQHGGYKLNDTIEISFADAKLSFTIKGFIEDVFFSSADTGLMGIYLPNETFKMVSEELSDAYKATLIFANLQNVNKDVEAGIRELSKVEVSSAFTDITRTLFSIDLALVKLSRILMASMVSIMIVAFAIILMAVCLIVVKFRISSSIEDDMTKIGSLKAIGYTSRQIVYSIVLQFVLIAFAGSIVGIMLSYLATPTLSNVFAQQSGLKWVQGFDGAISSIALSTILIIVVMVAFFAAARIKKLNPIVALRGGIITHSFRKNHLPLSTTKGSLPLVLALKSILQNMKQSIMIAIIIIAVSFAGTFAVVMFYNTTIDIKAFTQTPGIEISNAVAVLKPEDNTKLIETIKKMNDVRKVQFVDEAVVDIDNNQVSVYVVEDYSKKETNTVYQGRYPLHSNEIVLAGPLATMIKKTIGDSVVVKTKEAKAEFIICGLSQGSYMGGMSSSIRYDGVRKLIPMFQQQNLQIYLNKGVNAAEFVEKLETLYGDAIMSVLDMDRTMELGMGMYTSIVSKVGIGILMVTILVVILVLYFVINSSVTRIKRQLGVQKAIGFTTFQLMNQLSLGFLPPIIVGVCIGSLMGITQTNPIMTQAQRAMGIMKANYIITPGWIALFGVAIVIVSYSTSMLITYRIRKISAYALVSE